MTPEASRHRRRIGGLLAAGKLPWDYTPETRPMDPILCVLCRRPNPNPACSACPTCIPPDEGEMRLQGRVAALEAEVNTLHAACMEHVRIRNEMGKIIARLIATHDGESCRLDHHGYCQNHNYAAPCPVADARVLLSE